MRFSANARCPWTCAAPQGAGFTTAVPRAAVVRRRGNGPGVAGFVLGLVGLFACGVPSILGFLFSGWGMLRRPRGLATAGMVLSLIGLGELALIGLCAGAIRRDIAQSQAQAAAHRAQHTTQRQLDEAVHRLTHQAAAEGKALEDGAGRKAISDLNDGWGAGLHYQRLGDQGFEIRSAGPDGRFHTEDDLLRQGSSILQEMTHWGPPRPPHGPERFFHRAW